MRLSAAIVTMVQMKATIVTLTIYAKDKKSCSLMVKILINLLTKIKSSKWKLRMLQRKDKMRVHVKFFELSGIKRSEKGHKNP